MHEFPYPSYLATHRDTWRLSQPELGFLLGEYSGSAISKYERLVVPPHAEVLVGAEFIFSESARRIFPAFYATVEIGIVKRAARMAEALADRNGKAAAAKRELLEAIAHRVAGDTQIV